MVKITAIVFRRGKLRPLRPLLSAGSGLESAEIAAQSNRDNCQFILGGTYLAVVEVGSCLFKQPLHPGDV